jgi:hypothetical protein
MGTPIYFQHYTNSLYLQLGQSPKSRFLWKSNLFVFRPRKRL